VYTTNQKRYYSPRFSELSAVSVRRLAWALGLTMPKTVDQVVGLLPSLFPPGTVCRSCRDSAKCNSCAFFNRQPAAVPSI
jgi:hypothetical protein